MLSGIEHMLTQIIATTHTHAKSITFATDEVRSSMSQGAPGLVATPARQAAELALLEEIAKEAETLQAAAMELRHVLRSMPLIEPNEGAKQP